MMKKQILFVALLSLFMGVLITSAFAAPDSGAPVAALVADASTSAPALVVADAGIDPKNPSGLYGSVDPNNPGDILMLVVYMFQNGHWGFAIALIIMLLTWLFTRVLKQHIPKRVVPWIAIGLSTAMSVAVSFASGAAWYTAIGTGFTVGLAAVGGWEAFGPKPKKEPKSEG